MQKIQINLLKIDANATRDQDPRTSPLLSRRFFGLTSFFIIVLAATSFFSYAQSRDASSGINTTINSIFGQFPTFKDFAERQLSGEQEDRINILLLGIGGKNHDGPYLSDTIMIASIQPSTKKVALTSIPRDLLVSMEGYGWRKINNASAFGEATNPGDGARFAAKVVSDTFQIPIHYYVRVDFDGFEKIIDTLGGIQVTVDNAFTDYTYPAPNFKYQVVSFKEGEQTMDGDVALKFVRSRHSGMNNEGSDFARSKRQQKILAGVREKILSTQFFLNPKKISDVIATLKENISTNLEVRELIHLTQLLRTVNINSVQNFVFDDAPTNYLVAETIDGAFVLRPRTGSFEPLQQKIQHILDESVETPQTSSSAHITTPSILLENGTTIEGLASQMSIFLQKKGYTDIAIRNAKLKNIQTTTVYDFSSTYATASQNLQSLLHATLIKTMPDANDLREQQADFKIILGSDAAPILNLPNSATSTLHAPSPFPANNIILETR